MARSTAPRAFAAACLLLAALISPATATTRPTSAAAGSATVRVTGTLLAAAADGAAGQQAAIAVGDDLVPVSLSGTVPEPGSRVTAELLLPESVASRFTEEGAGRVALRAGTTAGRRALALVDARAETLSVLELVVQDVGEQGAAPGPVTHQVHVAAPDNLGTFMLSDVQMLGLVDQAAAYWEDEADGAITDMVVPGQVLRYAAEVATDVNNCGLDDEFFEVMEEARAVFPEADFVGGTDLLVLLAPSGCVSTSTSGRAVLGTGLGSGGFQVSRVADNFAKGTLAHEWGHNFGLMHSNLGPCDDFVCPGEYDNLYNVMGRGLSVTENRLTTLSTAFRSIAGILAPGEVAEVPFPESGGVMTETFELAPREAETGRRAARVVDPDTGDAVFVEYRSGAGQDALSAYALGVTHRGIQFRPGVVLESVDGSSAWLRRTPVEHGAMVEGDTWSNQSGTLTVSTGAVTLASASVTVVATPGAAWSSPTTVAIDGEPRVGHWLHADSAWDPQASTRRVQWYADGVAIAGATDHSYQLGPTDAGAQVRVALTDYGFGLRPRTTSSAPVQIAPGTLFAYDRPRVSGQPVVGATLTTNGAIWDGPQFSGPTSTALQWRAGGVAVAGATGSSYVVRAGDVGKQITVSDTGTRAGFSPLTLVSDPTAPVAAPDFPAPPTPVVTGSSRVGELLKADAGAWPVGTDLAFVWLSGGTAVPGSTGTTYSPVAGDVGRRIAVRVTATHSAYATLTRTSSATAQVGKGTLVAGTPRVTGTTKVGRTLTAAPRRWTPSATLRYAWLANGRAIRGADGRRLVLRSGHRGDRISVRVTGSLPGYVSRSATSARTRPVRR